MKPFFFDIDTQIDFVYPGGALYAPGAETVIPEVAALNRHATAHGFPLISTACAHAEQDPEFQIWGPHCVLGTLGQQKPAATLAGQKILNKQELDMFSNPDLPALLQEAAADEYIVYGVVTEVCVRFAADGLLKTGKPVTIVTDAVYPFNRAKADAYLSDFASRGGKLALTADIIRAQ